MALNMAALKGKQKELEERGSGNVVQASKLGSDFDYRVLPPIHPEQDGIYFVERKVWWIDGKPYLSPATFGYDDVIEEEIDEAEELAAKDRTLRKLLDDKKKLKQNTEYWLAALILSAEFDNKGNPKSVVVQDGTAKILAMGSMLFKATNKIAVGRQYQNGTDYGFTDRELGYNILGGKTGTGLNTDYSAQGWHQPWEMDEKYYTAKAIPNIVDITKKQLKTDEYLRSVIRNYLYGEAIIEDTSAKQSTDDGQEYEDEENTSRRAAPAKSNSRRTVEEESPKKPVGGRRTAAKQTQDEPEDATPAPTTRRGTKGRNLADDVANGLDALEDD